MFLEFDRGLNELTEAMIECNLQYDYYVEDLAIDEDGYYIQESTGLYVYEEALKETFEGVKNAINNMVQSFLDFLSGAFNKLLTKLRNATDGGVKGMASRLATKAGEAKTSVVNYWKQVKAIKVEPEKTGFLANIKAKISTIIERFKKMCADARAALGKAAGKVKDGLSYSKAKAGVKATAQAGAANRAAKNLGKAADAMGRIAD